MYPHKLTRKIILLIVLIVLAFIYIGWIFSQNPLTGTARWDGATGVLLGLYICAQPAANFLDLILFRSLVFQANPSRSTLIAWLTFNVLVLLAGWVVIFVGMTQFSKT